MAFSGAMRNGGLPETAPNCQALRRPWMVASDVVASEGRTVSTSHASTLIVGCADGAHGDRKFQQRRGWMFRAQADGPSSAKMLTMASARQKHQLGLTFVPGRARYNGPRRNISAGRTVSADTVADDLVRE
jgi:hypothetical protein